MLKNHIRLIPKTEPSRQSVSSPNVKKYHLTSPNHASKVKRLASAIFDLSSSIQAKAHVPKNVVLFTQLLLP